MKYIVILCDGMADEPLEELDGGSDTANLSVIGYDPRKYYSGRSPLEALSIGAEMGENDVSFRCNLVTLSEEEDRYEDRVILDHSSGEIPTEEAAVLVEALREGLGREGYTFYVGTSYRHLLIQKDGKAAELTPPHDILTKRIGEYLPEDPVLREMMVRSYEILKDHPVNVKRRAEGKNPANSIWLWGEGTRPALENFEKKFGKKGGVISAVDLIRGIGVYAGLKVIHVEGATGLYDTNYEGKAQAALAALKNDDFVYLHVEASDEAGHEGDAKLKIRTIEDLDRRIIGPIFEALQAENEPVAIAVLPDHPTPCAIRTHTNHPVPFLIYKPGMEPDKVSCFDEFSVQEGKCGLLEKDEFIKELVVCS